MLGYGLIRCAFVFTSIAQDDWNGTQRATASGKVPAQRQTKGAYREHPYGRY